MLLVATGTKVATAATTAAAWVLEVLIWEAKAVCAVTHGMAW